MGVGSNPNVQHNISLNTKHRQQVLFRAELNSWGVRDCLIGSQDAGPSEPWLAYVVAQTEGILSTHLGCSYGLLYRRQSSIWRSTLLFIMNVFLFGDVQDLNSTADAWQKGYVMTSQFWVNYRCEVSPRSRHHEMFRPFFWNDWLLPS